MSKEFLDTFARFVTIVSAHAEPAETFMLARSEARWNDAESSFAEIIGLHSELTTLCADLLAYAKTPGVPKLAIDAPSEWTAFLGRQIEEERDSLSKRIVISLEQAKRHSRKTAKQAEHILQRLVDADNAAARYRDDLAKRGEG